MLSNNYNLEFRIYHFDIFNLPVQIVCHLNHFVNNFEIEYRICCLHEFGISMTTVSLIALKSMIDENESNWM